MTLGRARGRGEVLWQHQPAPRPENWGGGKLLLLTVGASLLTVKLLCLQSLKALIRRTFPLYCGAQNDYTHFYYFGINFLITQDICYTELSGRNSFV